MELADLVQALAERIFIYKDAEKRHGSISSHPAVMNKIAKQTHKYLVYQSFLVAPFVSDLLMYWKSEKVWSIILNKISKLSDCSKVVYEFLGRWLIIWKKAQKWMAISDLLSQRRELNMQSWKTSRQSRIKESPHMKTAYFTKASLLFTHIWELGELGHYQKVKCLQSHLRYELESLIP